MKTISRYVAALAVTVLAAMSVSAQSNVRLPERPNRASRSDYAQYDRGFWCAVEATGGTTALSHRRNMQPVGLDVVGGYRFSEFLKVGIGVGGTYCIEAKHVRRSDDWLFPIYADVRGNFITQNDTDSAPYWEMAIGGQVNGGFWMGPTLGYRWGGQRSSFLLGLNFQLMQLDTWKKNNELLAVWSLKLGYEF